MPARILYVEDNPDKFLVLKLQKEGFEVVQAENGDEAINKLKEGAINAVLLDIMMPPGGQLSKIIKTQNFLSGVEPGFQSGLAFLDYLNNNDINIPVVVLTANPSQQVRKKAKEYPIVFRYMVKSSNISGILIAEIIREAMRKENAFK